jgi:hypothetical protein
MTDAKILALARVFDQEFTEYLVSDPCRGKVADGAAADMWSRLHSAVAQELKNMHGKRGELLFRNYAPQRHITKP